MAITRAIADIYYLVDFEVGRFDEEETIPVE
jgi:hypothetical protein